jgi:hypothetical protein
MPLLNACLGLCLAAVAQEPVLVSRLFKEGERETYVTRMQVAVPAGDVDITLKVRLTVRALRPDGGADVASELLEIKTALNGQSVPSGDLPKTRTATYRVDRSGKPVLSSEKEAAGFNFLLYMGLLADRALKTGESADVLWSDPAGSGRKLSGIVTLVSCEDQTVRLASKLTVVNDPKASPLTVDCISVFDRRSGKLQKASGTILGLPGALEAQAIQFSTEIQS